MWIKLVLMVIIMTLSGALGGYFFKRAASQAEKLFNVIEKPALYAGGFFYVLGAGLNILILKELPYTVVLPLTSLTYVWTMAISYMVLKEKITRLKITGVTLILVGSILLCAKVQL
jgi:drug/metabolite transporter (DMT)-like permease